MPYIICATFSRLLSYIGTSNTSRCMKRLDQNLLAKSLDMGAGASSVDDGTNLVDQAKVQMLPTPRKLVPKMIRAEKGALRTDDEELMILMSERTRRLVSPNKRKKTLLTKKLVLSHDQKVKKFCIVHHLWPV